MALFRRRTEDLNNKPFDPKADPETKAKEFDQQYGQNRGKAKGTVDPKVTGAPERGGKHRGKRGK